MATIAGDTFTEASDTALASHTPTGVNAGSGWTQRWGGATVFSASGTLRPTNTSSGNRGTISPPMDGEDCDVQADCSWEGTPSGFLAIGVIARGATTASEGVEFNYDINAGQWELAGQTLTEAWPGGTVTMLLKCRGATVEGYVNGVLKLQATDTTYRGGTYAGVNMMNFSGSNAARAIIDNFLATSYVPSATLMGQIWMG